MNIVAILFIIAIIILLYIAISYIIKDVNTLSGIASGTTMTMFSASSLAQNSDGNISTNFAYSVWMYISDWNYRYGEPKIIFARMTKPSNTSGSANESSIIDLGPCPSVILGAIANNIDIALTVYPGVDSTNMETTTSTSSIHTCNVQNIPIQKWVNLLISVYGRSLDVYLDGKLVKTCLLPGIAKINENANVYLTPNGGFSGWTAKFQYYSNSVNPQQAWNIYEAGYGANMLSNIFGKYQVQVSVVENGTVNSTMTL